MAVGLVLAVAIAGCGAGPALDSGKPMEGDGSASSSVAPSATTSGAPTSTPSSTAPSSSSTSESSTQPSLQFSTPVTAVQNGPSGNGGEPSLAIDAKGDFYVYPLGPLAKSSDDGKIWSDVPNPITLTGDHHVVVSPDGLVYVAGSSGASAPDGSCSCTPVAYSSKDDGATWTHSAPAGNPPYSDRPWVAALPGGIAYFIYNAQAPGSPDAVHHMTKTTDGGVTWVSVPAFQETGWNSFLFVDPKDGTVYTVQSTGSGVSMHVSTDGGSSFAIRPVAETGSNPFNNFVVGATDDAGNVYVVWSTINSGQDDVWMSWSSNKGVTWNSPTRISLGTGTHIFPWIAAGADGKVMVVWYGTDVVGNPNTLPASTAWYVHAAQSLHANVAQPVFSTAQVSNQSIHTGSICEGSGTACNNNRQLFDFFMAQIGPDGRAAIAYSQDDGTASSSKFVLQNGGPLFR